MPCLSTCSDFDSLAKHVRKAWGLPTKHTTHTLEQKDYMACNTDEGMLMGVKESECYSSHFTSLCSASSAATTLGVCRRNVIGF